MSVWMWASIGGGAVAAANQVRAVLAAGRLLDAEMPVDELIADTLLAVGRALGVVDHQRLLEIGHRTLRSVWTGRKLIADRAVR